MIQASYRLTRLALQSLRVCSLSSVRANTKDWEATSAFSASTPHQGSQRTFSSIFKRKRSHHNSAEEQSVVRLVSSPHCVVQTQSSRSITAAHSLPFGGRLPPSLSGARLGEPVKTWSKEKESSAAKWRLPPTKNRKTKDREIKPWCSYRRAADRRIHENTKEVPASP